MAYEQTEKILLSSPSSSDGFGTSCVIDGHHMIVQRASNGHMYIYKRDIGGVWQLQGDVSSSVVGSNIAAYGEYFIGSAPSLTTCYIYKKDDFAVPTQIITEPGATISFGKSIDISENYVVIGDHSANSNMGEIYIYEKTGTDTWTAYANNPVSVDLITPEDYFGSAVAVNSS